MNTPVAAISPLPGFSEPFSSLSHLLGGGLFLVISIVFLVRQHTRAYRSIAVGVYIFGVTFALAMSGVFHLLTPGTVAREVFQRLDHAAIFFLIAATYTPVHVILFRGFLRWGVLIFVWLVAVTAITLKSIYFHSIPEWLSLTLYLSLGWFGVYTTYHLYRRLGWQPIRPILHGALAYTAGAVMDFLQVPVLIPGVIGAHEAFHVLVLLGVFFHWTFIYRIARRERFATAEPAGYAAGGG